MDEEEYNFKYTFKFDEGNVTSFDIRINQEDVSLIPEVKESYPDWAMLDFNKCPNCPLDSAEVKYCPMATSIVDVVSPFVEVISYEEVEVTVESNERTYYRKGGLQEGLSSLLGLYMATSGCPNLKKLRPMAANHLPFSSLEETVYRVLSMYALALLLKGHTFKNSEEDFDELKDLYENIGIVNEQFCMRLRHFEKEDSNVNAVIILNNFAQFVPLSVSEDMLGDVKQLFKHYLE